MGDVDGDGDLDLVLLLGQNGAKHDYLGEKVSPIAHSRLIKIDLEKAVSAASNLRNLQVNVLPGLSDQQGSSDKSISDVQFRTVDQQPWTEYLGAHANSIYEDT